MQDDELEAIGSEYVAVAQAFYMLGAWAAYSNVAQTQTNIGQGMNSIIRLMCGPEAYEKWTGDAKKIAEDCKKNGRNMLENRHSTYFQDDEVWLSLFNRLEANLDLYIQTGIWGPDLDSSGGDAPPV